MSSYESAHIRNLALLSHQGAGKTSLAEAMLFLAGAVDRFGKVEDGNTVCDFEPEENERQISIVPALAFAEWKSAKVNLIDTPGYIDFAPEIEISLWAVDAAVVVLDGVAGVEVHTDRVYRQARDRGLPVAMFVNKLDKEHASFARTLAAIGEELDCTPVAVTLPLGEQSGLRGHVDLLSRQAFVQDGAKTTPTDLPADLEDAVAEARDQLVEAIAAADESLMEKYLEDAELTAEELRQGLRKAVLAGEFVPVVAGSAHRCMGVTALLDLVVGSLPSPLDAAPLSARKPDSEETVEISATDPSLAALVFKTMSDPYVGKLSLFRVVSGSLATNSTAYNVNQGQKEKVGQLFTVRGEKQFPVAKLNAGDLGGVAKLDVTHTGDTLADQSRPVMVAVPPPPDAFYSASMHAASRADEERLTTALARLDEEDRGFTWRRDRDTGELVAFGLGQLHLEIAMARLKRKFGVECDLGRPKIAYRETVRGSARVQGRHKKQTGGRGQFGDVWLRVEPLPRGGGVEFADEVKGGSVPHNFIPAVEKGVIDAMREGVIAGYPMVDVKVTLDDGSSHPVDSSELAFKLAGQIALRKAAQEAGPVLLEPIVEVEVVTPEEVLGDIMGDLNGKRGKIQGTEQRESLQVVKALVPLAEVASYGADLRRMAQGRADFTMKFSHYEEMPAHLADQVIAAYKRDKGESADE